MVHLVSSEKQECFQSASLKYEVSFYDSLPRNISSENLFIMLNKDELSDITLTFPNLYVDFFCVRVYF